MFLVVNVYNGIYSGMQDNAALPRVPLYLTVMYGGPCELLLVLNFMCINLICMIYVRRTRMNN